MAAFQRLDGSARFGFRFLCTAWLAGSASVLGLATGAPAPAAAQGLLLLLAASGAFGVGVLWRTRASGTRELLESMAALAFWSGVFAMVA